MTIPSPSGQTGIGREQRGWAARANPASSQNPRPWGAAALAFAIGVYQRYLSPYKGFSCAHRVLNGGQSCSEFCRQLVLADPLHVAWPRMRCRFLACREAALTLNRDGAMKAERRSRKARTKDGEWFHPGWCLVDGVSCCVPWP